MALACATLTAPLLAHAACQVKSLEMPVKLVGSRAVASVGIDGTPVPLAVDTGAFYSMLTDAAAQQLKLRLFRADGLDVRGITGKADVHVARVEKLQLLKGEFPRAEFIVGTNELGAGTMGLMGRNVLSLTDAEYDFAHGAIRLLVPNDDCERSNMAYWAGSSPVTEVDSVRSYGEGRLPPIRAHVKVNGVELVALFDTGATTMISAEAARRAGVADAAWKPAGTFHGAGRGTARMWTAAFDSFEIGGEAVRNNRLLVGDFTLDSVDMLLGIDFFLSHRIYVSKQQSKLFITYNGGAVFSLDRGRAVDSGASDAAAAADPNEARTADEYARRGAAFAARGEYERALVDLDKALQLEPATASFFAERGTVREALKRRADALDDYDKALALDPLETDSRMHRATLRLALLDRDGAKSDLDALDKTLAPQANLRRSMATLYLRLEQPAAALVQLDAWLAAHPKEVDRHVALNRRCWARALLGIDLRKALDDCDDAIDDEPKNAAYLDSRGWVYLRLGENDKALADFDRSLALKPRSPWSLYGRGLVRSRLGDGVRAEADLAAARAYEPGVDARIARAGLPTATVASTTGSASSQGGVASAPDRSRD